jgi:uncharacterized protein (TIGR03066 family)
MIVPVHLAAFRELAILPCFLNFGGLGMSILLAGIVAAMGPSALLSHKPTPPEARLFMLKSADAVVVWNALSKYVDDKSLFVAVALDVRTNSVLIAGDPELVKVLAAMIEKLDNPNASEDKPDYVKLIVGKWEVTNGDPPVPVGAISDFTKDGKVKVVIPFGDMTKTFELTYTLDGDKIKTKDKDGETTTTITKISDKEMTLNTDGKEFVLKRVN